MEELMSTSTIIIGGGVIGLMTALELADAGQDVTVLERSTCGSEASWAGGGILCPLYPWRYPHAVDVLARASMPLYPAIVERLQRTGIDPELLTSGLLVVDAEEHAAALRWGAATGQRVLACNGQDAAPALAHPYAQASLLPQIQQIRNPRLVRALRALALDRGVRILEHHPVDSVLIRLARVEGVLCQGREIRAATVVIAAGSWSARLFAAANPPPLAVQPVKGQMLLLDTPPGLVRRILLYRGRYLIPRRDGKLLVGSTMENAGFDKTVSAGAREELHAAAIELVPKLRHCPVIAHWSGLRPAGPGGIPYIGAHPLISGLYANTGHFRNGLCLAPASARLLADLVLNRPPLLDPAPYAWGSRAEGHDTDIVHVA
jgi:glycine oxidase